MGLCFLYFAAFENSAQAPATSGGPHRAAKKNAGGVLAVFTRIGDPSPQDFLFQAGTYCAFVCAGLKWKPCGMHASPSRKITAEF